MVHTSGFVNHAAATAGRVVEYTGVCAIGTQTAPTGEGLAKSARRGALGHSNTFRVAPAMSHCCCLLYLVSLAAEYIGTYCT